MIQKSFSYLLAMGMSGGYEFKELKDAKAGGGAPKAAEKKKDEPKKEAPKAAVIEEKVAEPTEDLGGFFDF